MPARIAMVHLVLGSVMSWLLFSSVSSRVVLSKTLSPSSGDTSQAPYLVVDSPLFHSKGTSLWLGSVTP